MTQEEVVLVSSLVEALARRDFDRVLELCERSDLTIDMIDQELNSYPTAISPFNGQIQASTEEFVWDNGNGKSLDVHLLTEEGLRSDLTLELEVRYVDSSPRLRIRGLHAM